MWWEGRGRVKSKRGDGGIAVVRGLGTAAEAALGGDMRFSDSPLAAQTRAKYVRHPSASSLSFCVC